MELKKHNTKTDIWKKKKIINLNQSYKKEQKFERERERERTQKFWGENMDWMGEMISNLEQKKKY